MLSRNAAIEIVENYTREIQAQGVHLQNVVMYDSFAKETQHEWSDIEEKTLVHVNKNRYLCQIFDTLNSICLWKH